GAGEIALLDALGIHQFVLAKLKNLTVVETDWKRADQQQSAQHEPQNTYAPGAHALPGGLPLHELGLDGRHRRNSSLRKYRERVGWHKGQGMRTCHWNDGTRGQIDGGGLRRSGWERKEQREIKRARLRADRSQDRPLQIGCWCLAYSRFNGRSIMS